ncbi:MAG: tRNA lysidine(34) synthetase TilS [Pseudomonadota bacterium]
MTQTPLPNRFRTATETLTGTSPDPGAPLGLAVSGGPDSLALLALAAEAYPGAVAAATVDHKLRPEAADEAEHVTALCRRLGVPHTVLTPDRPITGNIQSAGRTARYTLLDGWRGREKLRWVATAHHADDQLETILMRLMRGSGVDGLSAIRPINGAIIRPLLGVRKRELVAYIEGLGIDAVTDPSNEDIAFDRVRLREGLQGFPDFTPHLISRSADALREAGQALHWVCAREAEDHIERRDEAILLTRTDYPREIVRRLVIACLDGVDSGHAARGPALDQLIETLARGKKGMIGKILCEPQEPGIWRFSKAPPRKTG